MGDFSRARILWREGAARLLAGDPLDALRLFEESIDAEPTAEGYTYRGWAASSLGRVEEAIEDCRQAIRLDPDFGNPYNDIGVYLLRQGKLDEAVPWFETAKRARRFDARHLPFLNLGRIYSLKGEAMRALDEFLGALAAEPGDADALSEIQNLEYAVH